MKFLDEVDGRIKIYYSPYTLGLNPAAQQWRVRKKATGNSIYENTEEMQESLRTMHARKEIPVVKTGAYLAR